MKHSSSPTSHAAYATGFGRMVHSLNIGHFMRLGLLLGGLALGPAASMAAIIVQPTAVTANVAAFESSIAANMINGIGISDPSIVQTGDPVPVTYPVDITNSNGAAGLFQTQNTSFRILFDLGAGYSIDNMHIWNMDYFSALNQGIKDVAIYYTTNTVTVDDPLSNFTSLGSIEVPRSTLHAGDTYTGVDFALGTPGVGVEARYVLLDVSSNWSSPFSAVSEVRFTAVPEPATLGLFAGAGLFMVISRRRSANV